MKGYFPRLIEQTGIVSEPAIGSMSGAPVPPPTRPEEPNATTPIHVDQTELIESQEGDLVERTLESFGAAPDISVPTIDEEDDQNSTERNLDSEVPEAPNRSSEREKPRSQREPPEEREFVVHGLDRIRPQRNEAAGEPLEEETVETDAGGGLPAVGAKREALEEYRPIERVTSREDEQVASDKQVSEQAPANYKPTEKSQGRMNQAKTWEATLREVRGWVAGTPAANDAEAEKRDASKTKDARNTNTGSPFVEPERVATSYPKPTVPSPREEPQTQDLHLTIGTISLTVEEPQKEIPKKSSQRTETVGKQPATTSGRSRLSRYYIRGR